MAGMLQIITYLLAVYLIFKGVEILQIALAGGERNKGLTLTIGWLMVAISVFAAGSFVVMQDDQAKSLSRSPSGLKY